MCQRRWAASGTSPNWRGKQKLSPEERLRFHQERSGPLMNTLHDWMEAQLAARKTEPFSGLGKGPFDHLTRL